MSLFSKIGDFFKKVWAGIKDSADTVAITITQEIQDALKSGTLLSVAQVIEKILPTTGTIPEQIVTKLETLIPQVLAVELSIQALPANPTTADIQAFEQAVLTAFGLLDSHSKLYTTLAAQIYGIIKADVDSGKKYTFAQCVIDVETAWQYYQQDLQSQS